jgi:hypothetical protein
MKNINLFFFIIIILTNLCYAEDKAINQTKDYVDFKGGINTRTSESNIAKNEATVCENVVLDSTTGALTKRDSFQTAYTSASADIPTSIHRLYLSDETKITLKTRSNAIEICNDTTGVCTSALTLSASNHKFDWVTINNIAIGTDGYNQPVKSDGTKVTYLGSVHCADAGSGAGPNGAYTYKVTYYTASYEIGYNVISPAITVTDNDINLSMIPIAPDTFLGEDTIGRKIYRSGAGDTTYKLLTNGTIANNTATTLTDSDADAARTDAYAVDATCTPPMGRLAHLYKSRLFIANNPNAKSRVYWSEQDRYESFISDQLVDIRPDDGDQIMILETVLGNMLAGKENTMQFLYTDGATPLEDWSFSDPITNKGCRSIYSARNTPIGLFYLASDGVYLFNGQYAQIKSNKITNLIRLIDQSNRDNVYGAYENNRYYLTYTDSSQGESTNNKTLIYSLVDDSYTIFTKGFSCFSIFNGGTDAEILYAGSINSGSIYAFSDARYEIKHKKISDFSGTFTNMRYVPVDVGGDENSPIIMLARQGTIDELTGTIDELTGTIDRDELTGTYISPEISINAASLDKLYWNESIPSIGGTIKFYLRTGADSTALNAAAWSSAFTDAIGSDVSAITPLALIQYKIEMETPSLYYSPEIFYSNGYVIKITYNKAISLAETSIAMNWESGYDFLGYPSFKKELKYLEVDFEGEGTFNVVLENEFNETDTFSIDMDLEKYQYGYYKEAFTNGAFVATKIKLKILKDDLNKLIVKRISLVYDVDAGSIERIYL